jgi:hypothetical protein
LAHPEHNHLQLIFSKNHFVIGIFHLPVFWGVLRVSAATPQCRPEVLGSVAFFSF